MKKTNLLLLPALAGLAFLLMFARHAAAVPTWDSARQTSAEVLMQGLTDLTSSGNAQPATATALRDSGQAEAALRKLEAQLRGNGSLSGVVVLAPRIMQLLPDNALSRYLYALALAARGDADKAARITADLGAGNDADRLYALLAKAAIAKARGDLDAAARAATDARSLDPEHPYAWNLLGQVEAARNDLEKAREDFLTAVRYAPGFAAAWSNLGTVQYLTGDAVAAWESFSTAIRLSPGYCAPLIGRAAVSAGRSDHATAVTDLEACLKTEPGQPQASRLLAQQYLQAGRLDDAERMARTLLSSEGDLARTLLADIFLRRNQPQDARRELMAISDPDAQTYYLLAFCDMLQGNGDTAMEHVRKAGSLQPDAATLQLTAIVYAFHAGKPVDAKTLEKLGTDAVIGKLALYVAGNVQASGKHFGKAYGLWSRAENLLPGFTLRGVTEKEVAAATTAGEQRDLALGMLYYLKDLRPAARSAFGKALADNPDSFLANYFSGLIVARDGDAAQARRYLEQSLKKTPGFFPANYLLAELLLRSRDIDAAIRHYQAAADSNPDGGVLVKLALLYEEKGRSKDAEAAYRKFIAAYPDNFIGYNQLAWMLARDGKRLDEALELAGKADRLQPGNASVNDTLGWIWFRKKDYDRAQEYLLRANTVSEGRNPDILYHLASLRKAQGDYTAAKALVTKALDLDREFESSEQARRLLKELQDRK